MTKQEFLDAYTQCLNDAVLQYPDEYAFPLNQTPVVAYRMMQAIERKSYNKDSRALKTMSKRYGFKFTYQGINEFYSKLNQEVA